MAGNSPQEHNFNPNSTPSPQPGDSWTTRNMDMYLPPDYPTPRPMPTHFQHGFDPSNTLSLPQQPAPTSRHPSYSPEQGTTDQSFPNSPHYPAQHSFLDDGNGQFGYSHLNWPPAVNIPSATPGPSSAYTHSTPSPPYISTPESSPMHILPVSPPISPAIMLSPYPPSPSQLYTFNSPAPGTPPGTSDGFISPMHMVNQDPMTNPLKKSRTHRDQAALWKDIQADPTNQPILPQLMYKPHTQSDRRRYVEEVDLEEPIYFNTDAGLGVPLTDVLHSRVKRLMQRDETVFHGRGPSVSIRLEWPGYGQWSRQIPTKDFRSPPGPITRAKLAKNIAKCVYRFIEEHKDRNTEDEADPRWKVGRNIVLEDLVLLSLHHVSMGSWQPQLKIKNSLRPNTTHHQYPAYR